MPNPRSLRQSISRGRRATAVPFAYAEAEDCSALSPLIYTLNSQPHNWPSFRLLVPVGHGSKIFEDNFSFTPLRFLDSILSAREYSFSISSSLDENIMFTMPFSGMYASIPESEDTETFLSGPEKTEIYSTSPKRRLPLPAISFLLLLASVSMTVLGFFLGQRFPHDLNSTCTRHTSKYCEFWPLLQLLAIYFSESICSSSPYSRWYQYLLRFSWVWWQIYERERFSSRGGARSRRSMEKPGCRMWVNRFI